MKMKFSRSAVSVFVFGVYLVLIGGIFILIPNTLLSLVNLPTTQEVWIRLAGMLLVILAFYYLMAAITETKIFFTWTIYTRMGSVVVLLGFVLTDLISPIALLFWLGDLAGALWTWSALRRERLSSKT
jgi:hypothetical protein